MMWKQSWLPALRSFGPGMFGPQIFLTQVLSHIFGPVGPCCVNKNAIKLILKKSIDIKIRLNVHCCVPSRGLEFYPHVPILIPVIAVTETQIPATFPQPHDWDRLRVRERHCSPVCMHALVCARVFLLHLIRLVAATRSQLVCAHSPDGGGPCGRADLGPLDEMGLLDEAIYISVLHWTPL